MWLAAIIKSVVRLRKFLYVTDICRIRLIEIVQVFKLFINRYSLASRSRKLIRFKVLLPVIGGRKLNRRTGVLKGRNRFVEQVRLFDIFILLLGNQSRGYTSINGGFESADVKRASIRSLIKQVHERSATVPLIVPGGTYEAARGSEPDAWTGDRIGLRIRKALGQ